MQIDIYVNAHTTSSFARTETIKEECVDKVASGMFTKESFLKHNYRLGSKPYIKEVSRIEAIDIDYPEDFDIANAIYKEVIKKA